MRLDRRNLLLGAAATLAATPALAHHGWSRYDAEAELNLTGPVREISFANPHCTALVEADGKVWTCVLAPLSRMTNRGLPEGSIEVGETVTVVGYPHRIESAELRAERITVKGRTVELR